MHRKHVALIFTVLGLLQGCSKPSPPPELHVAAAANLSRVMPELGSTFEKRNGVNVVPSYGATAQLTQQITAGAPYDVLLAADTEHVDQLIKSGDALADSRGLYARGTLVLWAPKRPDLKTLNDIAGPNVAGIIIAKPELAPYGAAAVEALKNGGLWDKLQSKNIVYAPNISAAKQFVDTGNGDAGFTALSLIIDQPGNYFLVDEKLYSPINQAMCITKNAKDVATARAFTAFMKSDAAYAILQRYGYGRP